MSINLSFRTPEDLLRKIKSRDIKGSGFPGAIAKRDVERWYALLGEVLKTVSLVPAEIVVMVHAATRWLGPMNSENLAALPDQLRQEIGLDPFYRDAQLGLADQAEGWSLGVRAAVWDAAERYEVVAHQQPDLTFGAALHQAGLHTYDLDAEELAVVTSLLALEGDMLPAAYMRMIRDREDS